MRAGDFVGDNILNHARCCNVPNCGRVEAVAWLDRLLDCLALAPLHLKGFYLVKKFWIAGLIAVLFLASCQSSGTALRQFTKGDELASYDFSQPQSFEEGAYSAATLRVLDGVYQIDVMQADNVLWWGQWGDTYSDTLIDVDTEQQTDVNDNTYGVMCRVSGRIGQPQPVDPTLAAMMFNSTPEATAQTTAEATAAVVSAAATEAATSEAAATTEATSEATEAATAEATEATIAEATIEVTAEATATNALELRPVLTATPTTPAVVSTGDGYLFLIQGSGAFAIMRSHERSLTPLVDWTSSDVIKRGAEKNHLRAICAGNYLAFYINDQFVGEATDDRYQTGQVGLAASAANWLGTRIAFDNLTISTPVQK